MLIKTSTLKDRALDWAVAKSEGYTGTALESRTGEWYTPSTDWSQGGPIIEREGIGIYKLDGAWAAHCPLRRSGRSLHACMDGQPTALVAAMRSYVASKLGAEVDVPEELTK